MRFLTVATALFVGTSLAVPHHGGGACTKSYKTSYTKPSGTATSTSSYPATGSNTSSGPATTNTGSSTSSGPPTTTTGSSPPPPDTGFKCPSGLYSVPQCCSTDVLGLVDLDCQTPSSKKGCKEEGKRDRCCAVPIAGQDVLCTDPPGGGNPPGGNPPGNGGDEPVCPNGLYSNPQCCSVDVLGVADIDCKTPSSASSPADFSASCATSGQRARCCIIPIAGQAVLCEGPPGGNPPGSNPPGSDPPGGNPPGGDPPGGNPPGNSGDVCPKGLYSVPQCCATDVLGVADLDCKTPSSASSPADFSHSCADGGQRARCCVVPIAGQDVLCTDPLPGRNPPGGNPPGGNPPGGNPPGGDPPGGNPPGNSGDVCPKGLYSVPQCCATDVLGVADIDCQSPSEVATSGSGLAEVCAKTGQRGRCCVVPILGQDVLCTTPVGA